MTDVDHDTTGVKPPGAGVKRSAKVAMKNTSGNYFMVRIGYRYTSEPHQYSEWFMVGPGEGATVFRSVDYWTGPFTSGQVQWKIQGIKMEPSNSDNDLAIKYKGTSYAHRALQLSNDGKWQVHELRGKDEGTTVQIEVGSQEVKVISNGDGTTTIEFKEEFH